MCISGSSSFLEGLVFLVEIAGAFAFFSEQPELKPIVVFFAERHHFGFLSAALGGTLYR